MRDLLDVVLLERLALEEVDRRDIGLVRPVDREQHVVDAERHDGAEERGRGKIATAGDYQILRQVLRRRSFEAATRSGEMRLVVDPMQHERQALAEMAENEGEAREGVEHTGEDETQEMRPGVDAEAPGRQRELGVAV